VRRAEIAELRKCWGHRSVASDDGRAHNSVVLLNGWSCSSAEEFRHVMPM
jgi:hypothetical protein